VREIVETAYAVYVGRIGRRPGPMDDDYERQIAEGRVHVTDTDPIEGLVVLLEDDEQLVLDNVAVAPESQHRGVGLALIAFAEAVARGRGFPRILLYTHELMTENQALYASLGYREVERREEAGFRRVFMRKDL
jgi:ribosomal protein S18 acetylase RimI-like enzyme